jgi:hypothetical protein
MPLPLASPVQEVADLLSNFFHVIAHENIETRIKNFRKMRLTIPQSRG